MEAPIDYAESPIPFGGPIGIDVGGGGRRRGQFELCDWVKAYFPDEQFDQDPIPGMSQNVLDAAMRAGYLRTRLIGHRRPSSGEPMFCAAGTVSVREPRTQRQVRVAAFLRELK
jgi:hypothetical protein